MGILLIVAIAVVYIVLGVLYESYVHPLTILSGLPSAGFGALLTLLIFKVELSIYAFVGLIMLIGIVKKNAIMQIDFALEAERKEGKSPRDAIYRRLPDPLPSDHDDHHGGAARRPADRARLRRRRRSAQAARPGGRRRAGFFAVDDPLPDPGGLHLHGGDPRKWNAWKARKRQAAQGPRARHAGGTIRCRMNISQTFIERPIATSLLMAAIALFGGVAYRQLAVSDLPNVDFPTLLVTAAPARREPGDHGRRRGHAARKPVLHHRRPEFDDLARTRSAAPRSPWNSTSARKLDGAAVDVQAAITQASRLLPQGMPTPPTFTKVNPADQPILYLALTSPTLPLWTLDEYAETRIAQRISMISGVAQVQVLGAQKYAVHVQMDPHAHGRRARSASTKSRPRSRTGTSTCPPAPSSARSAPSPCRPADSC